MKSLFASLALLTVACGAPAPTGGNTPPPGGTVPAILAVQAGDGQQAEPGAALTVKPVVAVRDAAGLGVAGVTVNFSVDSGGGSLQATSAVTAADGTAGPGDWHLGSGEGRNVMSATAGALAKLKFVATAVVAPVTVATQSVGTEGGTITINRPGSPLDGFSLKIPAGALSAATTVTLSARSAGPTPLAAGYTIRTPVLVISAPGATLKEPALLRFNAGPVAGQTRAAFLINPTTGEMVFLPVISSDGTGITVALGELNPGSPSGAGLRAADGDQTELILTDINNLMIGGDVDTGYRPGVDDWDFPRQPIAGVPWATTGTIDPGQGMLATSLWYFLKQKKIDGPLWQRFQQAKGVPESNRSGLRWVGVTTPEFTSFWTTSQMVRTMNTEIQVNPTGFGSNQLKNIHYAMSPRTHAPLGLYLRASGSSDPDGPAEPVPVILYAGPSVDAPRMALAYRIAGRVVDFAIPDQPGVVFHVEFDDQDVVKPFVVSTSGGGTFTVTGIGVLSAMDLVHYTQLTAEWPLVVAGTIGDANGWPTPALRGDIFTFPNSAIETLNSADLPLVDDLTHWWRCPGCINSGFFTDDTHQESRVLLWRRVSRRDDGSYGAMPPAIATAATFSATDITPGLEAVSGYALYQAGPGSSMGNANGRGWFDWQTVRYRKIPATLSPSAPEGVANTDLTLTLTLTGPPGNLEYLWEFGDTQQLVTATLSTTHQWATAGTYPMSVLARDKNTKAHVARVLATVTITPPIQVWKFTTKSLVFSTSGNFSPNFGYNDGRWLVDSTILARIAAGVSQGGIRLVDAPFTPPGSPLRTAPAGIYLLEGASITLATLDDPATDNNFITTTFANAPLALPATPRVSGWNLVQDAAPVNPLCNVHADTYTRTGTITAGHVTGLRVPLCVQSVSLPVTNGQPLMSMEADVQFIGDGASGTITIAYHFYGEGLQSQNNAQRIGRLTFQATRVTQ